MALRVLAHAEPRQLVVEHLDVELALGHLERLHEILGQIRHGSLPRLDGLKNPAREIFGGRHGTFRGVFRCERKANVCWSAQGQTERTPQKKPAESIACVAKSCQLIITVSVRQSAPTPARNLLATPAGQCRLRRAR